MNSPISKDAPNKTRLSVKILAILFLIFFGLVAGEILVRLIAPHPKYAYNLVADEKMGMKYKPHFKGRATNIFGEFDTRIQINGEGFRDSERVLEKTPHTFRIAVIGDSFTAAEQVEENQCFVRRVESLLNEHLKKKGIENLRVEVLNFGIGGFEFQQYVLCYENYVRQYKPDLVLVASFVHNDLIGNAFYLQENNFGRPYYRLEDGILKLVPADMAKLTENYQAIQRRLTVRWYHHLQIYNAQKQIFWAIRQQLRWLNRKQQAPDEKEIWRQAGNSLFRYYVQNVDDPFVHQVDEISKQLIQRMASLTLQDGSAFYLAMLPAKENLFPENWPEELKDLPGLEKYTMDFNRPFQKISEFLPDMAASGKLLDLRSALRIASENHPVFYPRDSHFNGYGHEASAQAMAEWLWPAVESHSSQ